MLPTLVTRMGHLATFDSPSCLFPRNLTIAPSYLGSMCVSASSVNGHRFHCSAAGQGVYLLLWACSSTTQHRRLAFIGPVAWNNFPHKTRSKIFRCHPSNEQMYSEQIEIGRKDNAPSRIQNPAESIPVETMLWISSETASAVSDNATKIIE